MEFFGWFLLIPVGFILRVAYQFLNLEYKFSSKTPEGKKNIKQTIFSGLLVILFTFLASFLSFESKIVTDWQWIGLWFTYMAVGWAITSIFLSVIKLYEQRIKTTIKTDKDTKQV